ncbi:cytochrome c oxidase assembly protein [Oceanobacillus iheyensis]|uniref:cytochrome c oxidase assembly protein n=1 Tax=Oceanobacillus iheyensis TaxID=182710 RepID=UPI00363859C2
MKKAVLTILGVTTLFIAIGSPLNIIARLTFQGHMIQILLLTVVSAPLLVAGWKPIKINTFSFVHTCVSWLTKPWVSMLLLLSFFYGYHLPVAFDFARLELYWNHFFLFGLFISCILFWISILYRIKVSEKLWLYAGIHHLFLIPYFLFLYTANEGVYRVYSDITLFMSAIEVCLPVEINYPEQFYASLLPFDPVMHQQTGVVLFWISSCLIYIIVLFCKQSVQEGTVPSHS